MKTKIEAILNLFPEVAWDRFAGNIESEVGIFGWVKRPHGQRDFLFLKIDQGEVTQMVTSSAYFSHDFSERLGWGVSEHHDCKRVENHFENVNAIKL